MASRKLVTVVGATGIQGGAVVRTLLETGKSKIRGLTRDSTSEKAKALKLLSDDIEVVTCDITKSDDVQHAFKDSWAVFAVTDYWSQLDQPEAEIQQGTVMTDAVARLQIPYYIFSTVEDINKLSNGKLDVPLFSQKAKIRDYIKEKYPHVKTIYVEPAWYIQKWKNYGKLPKLDDGTVVFAAPLNATAKLHLVDIDDIGSIVYEILENPEEFVGQDICVCGEEISFQDVPKVFTKVTGIPAIAKTLTEEEFRTGFKMLPKSGQDDLFKMHKWIEEYGYYGQNKDWANGQTLTKLNTFEQWLRKTGWKGE